jgi:hypothetical protein
MKKILLLFSFFTAFHCYSQNDVIMLEKKGERVKTYGAGVDIEFETIYQQWFQGTIDLVRHDSIFINGSVFHYKEIAAIRLYRKHLNYQTDGALLMTAGAGVLLLGAVNGLVRHDPVSAWYTTTSYIIIARLFIIAFCK